jgi:aminopeptidase N
MYDDGFESSQPVYVNVTDPAQISSLFSSITYSKGSSLLFMLESTVGSQNFRDGLRVRKKKFSLKLSLKNVNIETFYVKRAT